MTLLSVRGLGIDFGGITAVNALDFDVQPGEIVSIIGPNGAGKTTLFNMISGIYQPSRGHVVLEGRDVTDMEPHKLAERGMSRTFQNLQSFDQMTALENVMVGCHMSERSPIWADLLRLPSSSRRNRQTQEKAMALLERVHLVKAAHMEASSLSYGALKRIDIARALACDPRILLLDEPAAGCNAVETEEIDELIAEIAKEGVAILLVEHDMKLVMKISDHVIALNYGEKLAEGKPSEISRDPKVVEAYLGSHGGKEAAHALG
ncbi:ABC transporter ATP-binding protein [Pseudovibrio sp. SPO723]|uniref:ABC transporter ATP-binding protein n=1 Tax=Nesiotobacter zosterae TaxID=392721 RepID=UPI0029C57286|nr:ABC transporter ATP-binding protein [Pseudovibrio sp. SPO723]MDX5593552.1 ABC transporter ATP-binding protein [Pseudovibrio sp. SPO723]